MKSKINKEVKLYAEKLLAELRKQIKILKELSKLKFRLNKICWMVDMSFVSGYFYDQDNYKEYLGTLVYETFGLSSILEILSKKNSELEILSEMIKTRTKAVNNYCLNRYLNSIEIRAYKGEK